MTSPAARILFRSCAPLLVLASGCGSRGPLFDVEVAPDAAVPDAGVADSAVDAEGDAGPDPLGGLLGCGVCVTQRCGSKVTRCLQQADCNRVLSCVLQKCVLSGLDLTCVQGCTTDPAAALKAFEILQCVTGVCGEACGGSLPFGGFGGFGG